MLTDKNTYVVFIQVSHVYAGDAKHFVLYLLALYSFSSLNLLSYSVCNSLNIFLRKL